MKANTRKRAGFMVSRTTLNVSSWNKGLRCTGDDKSPEKKNLLFKNEDHMGGVKEVMNRKTERK